MGGGWEGVVKPWQWPCALIVHSYSEICASQPAGARVATGSVNAKALPRDRLQ